MTVHEYLQTQKMVIDAGYGDEVEWSRRVLPPTDPDSFASEAIFVICNSGMKAQIARPIFERVMAALRDGESASTVFGHAGKAAAIDEIWAERSERLDEYNSATDKLSYLESLPWIGGITKYHLAKNFGLDVAKPDRHLVRVAARANTTPQELCERLAHESGDRIATVDVVIWRACNLGFIR